MSGNDYEAQFKFLKKETTNNGNKMVDFKLCT